MNNKSFLKTADNQNIYLDMHLWFMKYGQVVRATVSSIDSKDTIEIFGESFNGREFHEKLNSSENLFLFYPKRGNLKNLTPEEVTDNELVEEFNRLQYINNLEMIFDELYLNREICLNEEKVKDILNDIGNWRYWISNGEFSEEERKKLIEKNFEKLRRTALLTRK